MYNIKTQQAKAQHHVSVPTDVHHQDIHTRVDVQHQDTASKGTA